MGIMKPAPSVSVVHTEYYHFHAYLLADGAGALLPRHVFQRFTVRRTVLLVVVFFNPIYLQKDREGCLQIEFPPIIITYGEQRIALQFLKLLHRYHPVRYDLFHPWAGTIYGRNAHRSIPAPVFSKIIGSGAHPYTAQIGGGI